MQPSSPRDVASRHGLEQPQEGHRPTTGRQVLKEREDMRLAHSSQKIMRNLCREYGVSFTMPHGSSGESSKRKDKGGRSEPSSGHNSAGSSSSSCSDVEEAQEEADTYARWPAIKELLDGLQTGKRVDVLKEISKSLNESAERAAKNIKDFDARAAGSRAGDASPENVVNEELLNFDPSEMPAAQAVRRCQAMMPELKLLAQVQAEASKASMLRALKEAEELSAEAAAEASDSEASDTEKQNDIERKFHQLGDLPQGTHPDLQTVLDLQREEIRATAQRIKDAERDLQIKKCALEYVDGKLSMKESEADQELFNSCITLAQEMKATIYARQKEEAERKLIQDQKSMNVPTEEEVQEQIAESERLQAEVAVAAEQVRKLQEMSAQAMASVAEHDEGAAAGSREGSPEEGAKPEGEEEEGAEQKHAPQKPQVIYLQEGTEGAPKVVVDLTRVPEVHKELSRKAAALEEQIAAEDKRISNAEVIVRNAEQTLKVLEEAKTLLLEHVARERPALVEGLLPPPDVPDEPLEDDEQGGSTTPSSDEGEEEEDEEEEQERLKSLASEEQRIRSQLAEATEGDDVDNSSEEEKEGEDGQEKEEDAEAKAGRSQPKKDYGARCTRGLQKLAKRLREDPDAGGDADAEADSDSSSASSNSPRVWTPPPGLTREEAVSQLRSMPHEELQTLLRLRNDNARLMKQIEQARRELERLRVKQGNPKALLTAENPEGLLEEGVPPELVMEVRRKVRELCALRRRWWRDRQDESTTVRRSLAAMNLPEDADTDDHPPPAAQDSLFQRIHASMTLP